MDTKTVYNTAEYVLDNWSKQKIGGHGHVIEIDESKFGNRKYNRGRCVVGKWVLGEYCRKTDFLLVHLNFYFGREQKCVNPISFLESSISVPYAHKKCNGINFWRGPSIFQIN